MVWISQTARDLCLKNLVHVPTGDMNGEGVSSVQEWKLQSQWLADFIAFKSNPFEKILGSW